uniref:neutral zinc metallopeptidase n=1 Tax=Cyanobium sp. TaxID=2164130 RepID=UPI00404890BA
MREKISSCLVNTIKMLAILLVSIEPTFSAELGLGASVDVTAKALLEASNKFAAMVKRKQPQILFGLEGTAVYGGCVNGGGDTRIPGSYYCESTNTIILEINQLEELRKSFGDGAVAYALSHEFGHWVQTAQTKEARAKGVDAELQADCIGGALLVAIAQQIGLTQEDARESLRTAYAIGGDTSHGTSEQRTSSLALGMQEGINACMSKRGSKTEQYKTSSIAKSTDGKTRQNRPSEMNQPEPSSPQPGAPKIADFQREQSRYVWRYIGNNLYGEYWFPNELMSRWQVDCKRKMFRENYRHGWSKWKDIAEETSDNFRFACLGIKPKSNKLLYDQSHPNARKTFYNASAGYIWEWWGGGNLTWDEKDYATGSLRERWNVSCNKNTIRYSRNGGWTQDEQGNSNPRWRFSCLGEIPSK